MGLVAFFERWRRSLLKRKFRKVMVSTEKIRLGAAFTAVARDPQGNVKAMRHSGFDGLSSEIDIAGDGSVEFSISGSPPQGETGSIQVGNALISHLNRQGANWGAAHEPSGRERGIDCVAEDGSDKIQMQVTRVLDQEIWKKTAEVGTAAGTTHTPQIADQLLASIHSKAKGDHSNIVLVLDAQHAPHVLPNVVDQLRKDHSAEIRKLGFQSVWLVGPTSDLIQQLDSHS